MIKYLVISCEHLPFEMEYAGRIFDTKEAAEKWQKTLESGSPVLGKHVVVEVFQEI